MRILFVPMPEGGLSHLIPLLVLHTKVTSKSIQTAFLAHKSMHAFLKKARVPVLDIEHQKIKEHGFRTEMQAYGVYQPDVVIDDTSLTTGIATALSDIPRITIQRTGIFPGYRPRFQHHHHSMGAAIDEVPNISFPELPKLTHFTDLFNADLKIVPGIPSVERLPPALQNDPSYLFAGPLVMDDYLFEENQNRNKHSLAQFFTTNQLEKTTPFEGLTSFFKRHQEQPIIYATFGTIAEADSVIFDCIRHMLDSGVAVVSSIYVDDLTPEQASRFYFAHYLPMHYICQKVDLMLHHCGSGTYQYLLLHQVPSITIGTMRFDRDDVALRLEELGVSTHLPAPEETTDFLNLFKRTFQAHLGKPNQLIANKKANLKKLSAELATVSAKFNFEEILSRVVH